ncbi:hypothetical protein [Flavobacterium rhizosphaerae]|uniref:Uncharacterized protein n=1 Tax=Flavobacterium rhizosphaerae TaxID=3163298 RepID=A0ABW8YUW7_9FLAO
MSQQTTNDFTYTINGYYHNPAQASLFVCLPPELRKGEYIFGNQYNISQNINGSHLNAVAILFKCDDNTTPLFNSAQTYYKKQFNLTSFSSSHSGARPYDINADKTLIVFFHDDSFNQNHDLEILYNMIPDAYNKITTDQQPYNTQIAEKEPRRAGMSIVPKF